MTAPDKPQSAEFFTVMRAAIDGYMKHRSSMLAAGLSFRALLSVAPLLVVAQAIVGIFAGEARSRAAILAPISTTMGYRAENVIGGWLDAARHYSGAATTIGVVLFLIGATRLVLALDEALDAIFEVPFRADLQLPATILDWLKQQGKALAVTIGLMLTLALGVGVEAWVSSALRPDGGIVASVLTPGAEWLLASVLLVGFLMLIYASLPSVSMSIRDVMVGALVSAVALELGSGALWLYFRYVDVSAAYGAAGAIVLVLIWLYYSAEAFVLGAEITAAERCAHRSERRAARRAARAAKAARGANPHRPAVAG